MPFCPSVLSVLGTVVPYLFFFVLSSNHHVAFICAASQPENTLCKTFESRSFRRYFPVGTTNHEPRITRKRAFYLFFLFFIPSVVINFFLERLTPWDSRERCVSLSGAYFFFFFCFYKFWRHNGGTRKWIRAYFVAIW